MLNDHLIIAIFALMLAAAAGGAHRFWQNAGLPLFARAPTRLIRFLERKLNRERRSLIARRRRGALVTVALTLAAASIGGALAAILHRFYSGMLLEILIVSCLLPWRTSLETARTIQKALQSGALDTAKQELQGTPWRNSALLDTHATARAAIELLAARFTGPLAGGIFWYVLLGLPGLCAALILHTLRDTLFSQKDAFGALACHAEAVVDAIPSRIAALLLALAALFLPQMKATSAVFNALRTLLLSGTYISPLAAMASGLNLSLGGPLSPYASAAWVGPGTAKATPVHIERALQLYGLASLLLLVLLGLALLLRGV